MAEGALIVTSKGFGKIVLEENFPTRRRGGKGVAAFKVTDESGPVVAVEHVQTEVGQRVLIVTAQGMSLMFPVDEIIIRTRTSGGVRIMNLAEGDEIVAVVV